MPRFAATLPEEEASDPAREGTCAAWVAEMVLTGQVAQTSDLIDTSHENGWLVDAEMAYHIQGYVNLLRSRGGRIVAEQFVRLNEMIAGTPDAIAIIDDQGVLYGDDLKYGYATVNPYRNTQVCIYLAAVMATLNIPITKVVVGIYQPRSMHPDGIHRTWEITPDELLEFVQWIKEQGYKCQDPNSIATPGNHCEYCPAAAGCDALARSSYKGFQVLTGTQQVTMNGQQLAQEIEFLERLEKMLKARKTAIEAEAKARINKGEYVPGWHLEQRLGTRKFDVSAGELALATGLNPYAEEKLCTPAEMVRRGAPEELVNRMSTRPRIQPKLSRREGNHFQRLFEGKE